MLVWVFVWLFVYLLYSVVGSCVWASFVGLCVRLFRVSCWFLFVSAVACLCVCLFSLFYSVFVCLCVLFVCFV